MGDGGDRWGRPPPTRFYCEAIVGGTRPMGETAPNAVLLRGYYGGTRPMGETAPNAGY
jgi:hypothetical protein